MKNHEIKVENEVIGYALEKRDAEKTFVVVHGSLMSRRAMVPLTEELKEGNIILMDLPAHGESKGTAFETVKDMAVVVSDAISAIVKEHELADNITIIGWSMGGSVAFEVARLNPMIKNIVGIGTSTDWSTIPPLPPGFNDFAGLFSSQMTKRTPKEIVDFYRDYGNEIAAPMEVCAADFKALADFKVTPVSNPTLLIVGDKDGLATIEKQVELHKMLENSEMCVLPNRSHYIAEEVPARIAAEIYEFLKHQ